VEETLENARRYNRWTKFILNGSALAATSLLLRGIGVLWNSFLTARLGAAGVGLISLTMSVYMLAVTFATSAVGFAATKLVAEARARGVPGGGREIMKTCICHALVTGSVACMVLTLGADYIGGVWLGDVRTIPSLRLLAISLPPIAVSSALSGYFTAIRKVYKNAATRLLEQFVKLTVTAAALMFFAPPDAGLEFMCALVVGGASIAEGASLGISALFYILDPVRRGEVKEDLPPRAERSRSNISLLLSVTVPLSVSAYVRSALITIEHILVPRGLKKYGAGHESALASYGVLHGMVLPLVLLPSSILYSYASLLVTELAEAKAQHNYPLIRRIIVRALAATLVYASATAVVLVIWSDYLGMTLYKTAEAGGFIRAMAPLVPVMYLDTVIDCILKGLGEQVYSMKVNILDSAVSALLVWLLVPGFGIAGYAATIYIAELLNFALSIARAASYALGANKVAPQEKLPVKTNAA
jgi:O-antigen/teichoic acid export membrane protein